MNTLILYDSLYGNTKIIAEAIGEAVSGQVTLINVTDVDISEIGAYDLLLLGGPTHGGGISENVQALLEQIPPSALEGKPVAAFDTRMTNKLILLFGCAAPKIAGTLKQKGGELVGKPEGFFVSGGKGPLKDGEVERAADWGREIAAQV
jgi:flavodoxin